MFWRRGGKATADPIADFWGWWSAQAADTADAAIATGDYGSLPDEMTRRVQAIHQDLEWEFSAGTQARHALCVTAAGIAELRPLAERVQRAAPAPTTTWEYHPARTARVDLSTARLAYGPHHLDCDQVRYHVTVDDESQVLDIGVHHGVFASLPDDDRVRIAYLLLDWLLGEDGVERWTGEIRTLEKAPGDGMTADGVTETVRALAARHAEVRWAILVHEPSDAPPALITARRPLKWIDFPLHDQHLAVSLRYDESTSAGLPAPAALDQLRAAEDDLTSVLGDDAVLVAHETSNGTRTFHLYAESDNPRAGTAALAWANRRPGRAQVDLSADPGWKAVSAYR